jgi:BirA family biotin operon repressor/biotin-[acetyl-CoA-carboxylase] ligase
MPRCPPRSRQADRQPVTPFIARQERFAQVDSTQDVVRAWLAAGTPEVCLAVADEQAAGRGRSGRTWVAPAGRALLLSLGFRPTWLAPEHAWRLAATVSLAMADAAEDTAGLRDRAIRLKWPNDLVVEDDLPGEEGTGFGGGAIRKLSGVLGETDGLGTEAPQVVVGIGINADWAAADFPADLAATMTSLRHASDGRPISLAFLLDGFLSRLEARVEALRASRFDVGDWVARQLTTGRLVRLEGHGPVAEERLAVGVDPASGALLVADDTVPGGERAVHAGEVTRIRLAEATRPESPRLDVAPPAPRSADAARPSAAGA